jgi:hypothetical protein
VGEWVMPKEVGQAYEVIAKEVFGEDAHRRRSPLQRVHQLLKFVGQGFPDGRVKDWARLHEKFDRVHPRAYKNAQSMQATGCRFGCSRRRGESVRLLRLEGRLVARTSRARAALSRLSRRHTRGARMPGDARGHRWTI